MLTFRQKPQTVSHLTKKSRMIVNEIKSDPNFVCLINHVTGMLFHFLHVYRINPRSIASLRTWYAELSQMYEQLQLRLLVEKVILDDIMEGSPFCATTVNFGPKAAMKIHRDSKNLIGGLCALVVLGSFNHKTSGHLLLHDLKTIIELRPGDIIFLPSAGIAHSNSPVKEWEDRSSIVQYTAGGLFRWLWAKETDDDGRDIRSNLGTLRWSESLDLLGNIESVEEAGVTGLIRGRNMEAIVKEGRSYLIPPPVEL